MISVFAPAKLNLHLHVVGRRPDGYHLLDSLFAFVDVGDTLRVAPADELTLTATGSCANALCASADNLVLRAAVALRKLAGVRAGAALHLEKELPVASGIGGGSTDAAAALTALIRLWGVAPAPARLIALAARLGADVPACLDPRARHVSGIGEVLEPAAPLPPAWLVLANPRVTLATAAVFRARTGAFSAPAPRAAPRDAAALAALLRDRRNDLTAAARALAPEVGETLAALEALPGALVARMSGSGATCFALFAERAAAESAAAALRAAQPGWWVAATTWFTADRARAA